jgi:hypothetical protein
VKADPLLADDNWAYIELSRVLEDVIDRVTDDVLNTLLLEDGRDGVSNFHGVSFPGARLRSAANCDTDR